VAENVLQSAIVVVIVWRTKMLMKKICLRAKNRESGQRQSVAAENRAAGLTAQLKELGETESGASGGIPDDADCVCRISGESYECCL